MAKRTGLSPAQKTEVVLKLLRRETTARELARQYKISEHTLYRYRDQFLEGGKAAFKDGKGSRKEKDQVRELRKEIEKREQVIGELTIANRILKKTLEGPY